MKNKCEQCSMDGVYTEQINYIKRFYCEHHKTANSTKIDIVQNKNLFQDLLPLITVLIIICLLPFTRQLGREIDWMLYMMDWMGIFFLIFGGLKLLDLKGFAVGFASYDVIAKNIFNYGYIYPFMEIILGIMYLFGFMFLWQNILIIGLSLLGMYSAFKVIVNKEEIRCVCLGTFFHIPMTWATFIENALMLIMIIIMLTLPTRNMIM